MSDEVTTEVEETTETTETTEMAFVDSFIESLSDDELKSHKMWDNLKGKNADEFGQYVRELKSFTGKKGDIPKPIEQGGTEEEWSAFYQKLGHPETMDGYDFGIGEEFKQVVGEANMPFYEKAVDWFKEKAFASGMSNDMADNLVDEYLEMIVGQTNEIGEARAEREGEADLALKNEWGDSREGIETGIKALLKDRGGLSEEDVAGLVDAGLFKEPKLAIALGKVAATFDDEGEIGSLQAKTMAGLEDQKFELEAEMQKAYKATGKIPAHLTEKWQRVNSQLDVD